MRTKYLKDNIVVMEIGSYLIKMQFKSIYFIKKWQDNGMPIVRIDKEEFRKNFGIVQYWEENKGE